MKCVCDSLDHTTLPQQNQRFFLFFFFFLVLPCFVLRGRLQGQRADVVGAWRRAELGCMIESHKESVKVNKKETKILPNYNYKISKVFLLYFSFLNSISIYDKNIQIA